MYKFCEMFSSMLKLFVDITLHNYDSYNNYYIYKEINS